jgi:hypothetical protein
MSATVYSRHPTTGQYTVVETSGLACLLQQAPHQPAPAGPQRGEAAPDGVLYWHPDYAMSEYAQVEVSAFPGVRWNIVAGSVWPDVAPGAVAIARHADVVRAK